MKIVNAFSLSLAFHAIVLFVAMGWPHGQEEPASPVESVRNQEIQIALMSERANSSAQIPLRAPSSNLPPISIPEINPPVVCNPVINPTVPSIPAASAQAGDWRAAANTNTRSAHHNAAGSGIQKGNDAPGSAGPATPPGYLQNPTPAYPDAARHGRIEGEVRLIIWVDAGGMPVKISLKQSSGSSILDRAAIQAVKNWKFEPARRNGTAVGAVVEVPIRFKLSETSRRTR